MSVNGLFIGSTPAPIGFAKEFLVVANNLTMKEVEIEAGEIRFYPKNNRKRDALGLARRISKRLFIADLVDTKQFHSWSNLGIYQERLAELIDLRGWPEITRYHLNVNLSLGISKSHGHYVCMELSCEEYGDF